MSKWNRPMRAFKSYVPLCAVCHKPMTASVYDAAHNAYVHPYDCLAPKGRPSRERRAQLRREAGVA